MNKLLRGIRNLAGLAVLAGMLISASAKEGFSSDFSENADKLTTTNYTPYKSPDVSGLDTASMGAEELAKLYNKQLGDQGPKLVLN